MEMQSSYLTQARRLHRECPVVDAHLDLAAELYFRKRSGEKEPLRDRYLKNLRIGGFNLIVSSVYVSDSLLPEMGLRAALDQIAVLLEELDKNKDFLAVRNRKDLDRMLQEDRIGVLMYMEGLDCIGNDRSLLRILWELGVRGASLTWSRRNALASGCCRGGEFREIRGGLSEDGFQAVHELERLGMFLDVSHLNDDGFADLMQASSGPVAATHSDSRAVHFHYRNLTDAQLRKIGERGGVVGLNGCDCIAGCAGGADPLETLCRHVEHASKLAGAGHVGYGFDFCDGLNDSEPKTVFRESHGDLLVDHSHVPELTAALLQRGMDEECVKGVIGGNWVRFFREALPE